MFARELRFLRGIRHEGEEPTVFPQQTAGLAARPGGHFIPLEQGCRRRAPLDSASAGDSEGCTTRLHCGPSDGMMGAADSRGDTVVATVKILVFKGSQLSMMGSLPAVAEPGMAVELG